MPTQLDIQRHLDELRARPELLERYDVTGDGEIDEREWDLIERMIRLELQTARKRGSEYSLDIPPTTLRDRYELVGLLGRGGQAFTTLARDLEDDGRHVVIKQLAIHVAEDWKSIELFEREAEVLERLTHPRIPRYIDAFHIDDRGMVRFALVQDFVDGVDLGHLTDRGRRWDEAEAIERMIEVCDILEYLHGKTPPVIHRDIKPSNLILGRDDGLFLVDFGAVQTVLPKTVGGSTVIGTTGYVPMEQYMGRASQRSDLYALGATAVHLLSGTHPADLPFSGGRLEFGDHIDVSDDFRRLLRRLLEPAMEGRPESATKLRESLDHLRRLGSTDDTRTWRVDSRPRGAAVYRAGVHLGDTPTDVTLDVEALPASILLKREGYTSLKVDLEVEHPRVMVEMKPEPLRSWQVQTDPPGAVVRSGEFVLGRTPLGVEARENELPMELTLEKGPFGSRRVVLRPATPSKISARLRPPPQEKSESADDARSTPSSAVVPAVTRPPWTKLRITTNDDGRMRLRSIAVGPIATLQAIALPGILLLALLYSPLMLFLAVLLAVPFLSETHILDLGPQGWSTHDGSGELSEIERIEVAQELVFLHLKSGDSVRVPTASLTFSERAWVRKTLDSALARLRDDEPSLRPRD